MSPIPTADAHTPTGGSLRRRDIVTFIVVTAALVGVGLVGGALLLRRVQSQLYTQQSASERRNAEAMARILVRDLRSGQPEAAVIARLQAVTEGMAQESDFLCLIDHDGRLLSHPNPSMVGMSKAAMAITPLDAAVPRTTYGEILRTGRELAGIVTGVAGDAAQLVYFHPVPGTEWTVTAHENAGAVARQLERLGWQLAAILAPTVALMALAGTIVARALGRRYERRIEAANAELERRVAERTAELSVALAELRTAHERLVQGEKMHLLGELMSGIAHEINNPMTVVQGYSELLTGAGFSPEVRGHAGKLGAAAARVRSIVETLLDFARQRPPTRRPVALPQLLLRVQDLIGADLRRAGVTLTVSALENLPELNLDAQQIEQVLLNLLNNARQALVRHEGEKQIRLTVEAEVGAVVIEVADTGPGLAPEVRARLFQPFVSTKPEGNGIGLSLCRRFVEAHGGRIDAPAVVCGCVFRVQLPCMAATRTMEAAAVPGAEPVLV
jgi:signal transduction histidine kinase